MTEPHQEPEPSAGEDSGGPPPPPERSRQLVIELLIVLLLFVAPAVASGRFDPVSFSQERSLSSEVRGLVWDLGAIGLLLYLAYNSKRNFRVLGLRPTRWWKELIWGVVICIAAGFSPHCAASIWLLFGLFGFGVDPEALGQRLTVVEDSSLLAAILPVSLLTGAFLEEILFRAPRGSATASRPADSRRDASGVSFRSFIAAPKTFTLGRDGFGSSVRFEKGDCLCGSYCRFSPASPCTRSSAWS